MIAVSMVLVAALFGAVAYLGFKLDPFVSTIVALIALVLMMLYNSVSTSLRDRRDLGDQIADLSRGTGDIARQVGEISRRLTTMEARVDGVLDRARATVDPLTSDIEELGGMVLELGKSVADHAAVLQKAGVLPAPGEPAINLDAKPAVIADARRATSKNGAARGRKGRANASLAEAVAQAIEANRIDLYLQPIVALPQRKVRYYEALTRLRTERGDIIPASEFVEHAESAGLMPKIDTLLLFRSVQVTRHLQLKSRDIGLFCNISAATLRDATYFKQIRDFMDANRALGPALMFEFKQSACRAFGSVEQESLAALAELGFHFSMDHVVDLHMEPKDLANASVRFMKVPAKLLLDPAIGAQSEIHPADLADRLARAGIDLIAEHIESERTVVDLLDYDVRFGQGYLFSRPRPVRTAALGDGENGKPAGEASVEPPIMAAGGG
jgi:cyclic-di-GMP phosphodiesterase TipF (flagellum assembly factor)